MIRDDGRRTLLFVLDVAIQQLSRDVAAHPSIVQLTGVSQPASAVGGDVDIMRLRSILFWLHLPLGVIAGAVILIMSVTGVLLTYQRQITAWADMRGYRVERAAQRLPADVLAPCSAKETARAFAPFSASSSSGTDTLARQAPAVRVDEQSLAPQISRSSSSW